MKQTFVLLAIVIAFVYGTNPAIDKQMIERVNSVPTSTWKAGVNEFFVGKTEEQVKKLLGWKPDGIKKLPTVTNIRSDIPASFNSTTQWPQCTTIGTIYNQAECGSCWAFGCIEAASDRFCIASKGAFNQVLSFADEVSCNNNCDGCEGGDADSAWDFIQQNGVVTDSCYPYTIPTCPPVQQPCLNFSATPNCLSQCNGSLVWTKSLHYISNAYDVGGNVSGIQTDLMTNGPVEACFTVYADFVNYKSGVYQYQTGAALGGHCIKIIGWGVENGTPYWLCNNSWTTYWGDNGQFKILRGQDECGIEDDVVAGTPTV